MLNGLNQELSGHFQENFLLFVFGKAFCRFHTRHELQSGRQAMYRLGFGDTFSSVKHLESYSPGLYQYIPVRTVVHSHMYYDFTKYVPVDTFDVKFRVSAYQYVPVRTFKSAFKYVPEHTITY